MHAFVDSEAISTQSDGCNHEDAMSLNSANATGNAARLILAVTLIGREPSLDLGTPAKPPIMIHRVFLVLSISHDEPRHVTRSF